MIVCVIFGEQYKIHYLTLGGIIFCAVGLSVLGLIVKIKMWKEINHEFKQNEETGEGPESAGELVQACFGFTEEGKERLKKSSFKNKLKVIAVFASFGLLLLTMAIGIVFANVGTLGDGTITNTAIIGFILMGIGGGGFFLIIFLLVIISKIKHR